MYLYWRAHSPQNIPVCLAEEERGMTLFIFFWQGSKRMVPSDRLEHKGIFDYAGERTKSGKWFTQSGI
jgi:hypothetical protein